MTVAGARTSRWSRGALLRALPSVAAQAVTAAASLLLQVVALLRLGLAQYGAFAVLLALLVGVTALYTGYVGDSLAVLDRHHADYRVGIATSAFAGWIAGFVLAVALSLLLQPGRPMTAVVYGGLVVCWLARETVRRLFIARLEFGRLLVADLGFLVVTVLVLTGLWGLGSLWGLGDGVGLAVLFAAMAAGSIAALVLGVGLLPAIEVRGLRVGVAGVRAVADFAKWRALQAGLRPLSLLVVRLLVAGLVSLSAVGVLEAARLVVAPLQVVVNGSGSFLLGTFAARERADGQDGPAPGTRRLARSAAWSLGGVIAVVGGVVAVLVGLVAPAVAGVDLGVTAVFGWVAYLVVWAAGLPFVSRLVARRRSREIFEVRLLDSAAGLVIVVLALGLGAGVVVVPWLLAATGAYSVWRLSALAGESS